MKKLLAFILALSLAVSLLSGCGKSAADMHQTEVTASPVPENWDELDEETKQIVQRIEADRIPEAGQGTSGNKPVIAVSGDYFAYEHQNVLKLYESLYGTVPFEFTFMPSSSLAELDSWSANIKVQILSGGGPDAFILRTYVSEGYGSETSSRQNFLFPELARSMRSTVFLPLDDVMDESEYFHPEDHVQVVINAGKTSEGQIILPLLYGIPGYIMSSDLVGEDAAQIHTWEDYKATQNPFLLYVLPWMAENWFCGLYPDVIDYDTEQVVITEEALAARMKEVDDLYDLRSENPNASDRGILSEGGYTGSMALKTMNENKNAMLVPGYDANGGLTARITAFCAINRNTKHAEECWKLIELLYSDDVQSGYISYASEVFASDIAAPEGTAFGVLSCGIPTGKASAAYGFFKEAADRITGARFPGCYDELVHQMVSELGVRNYKDENGNTDYNAAAAAMISEMKMILAE